MGFTAYPGSYYTWNSALFSWDDPDSVKTWNDSYPAIFIGEFDEPVNIAEVLSNSPKPAFNETFPVFSDDVVKNTGKNADEPLSFAELFNRIAEFEPLFSEAFSISEADFKNYQQALSESIGVEESVFFAFGMNKAEAFMLEELFDRTINWQRVHDENFLFADAYFRNIEVNKAETLQVYDTLVRQGPIVVSDLVVRADEVSFTSFVLTVSSNVPSGYGTFQPFVIGDYDLTRALIKITMSRENEQQDLRLLTGKVFADVPDVRDSGEITVSVAGTTTVVFNRKFLIPPKITIGVLGVSGGGSHRVFDVTKTQFKIELLDNTGAVTTGFATWHAEGY